GIRGLHVAGVQTCALPIFHAAERFGQEEVLEAVEEGLDRRGAARQLEADHAAESGLLARGDVVAGVAPEPRVIDAPDGRMARQRSEERRVGQEGAWERV